jgi:hypothetical protein
METNPQRPPEVLDLQKVDGAFNFEEGFSRPDWRVISTAIGENNIESYDLDAAWNEAARQWVNQLQTDLGGNYQVLESRRFLLLSTQETEARVNTLEFAEKTLSQIRDRLGDAAWKPRHGKHVILIFEDEDDYYQYISYFYPNGEHPRSGGCLLRAGYVHIAMPYEPFGLRRTIAHELTHNCVVRLRLPLWLNEGLATTFERAAAVYPSPLLDHDLKERHVAFWNEQNIQEFWAGGSFRKPGDSNELSYSLAEIVLHLLRECTGDWGAFIKTADPRDGGQSAAIECLDVDLGKVMETFLGEGKWRPRRKDIAALWEARKPKPAENT